jgi:hypothetical protein
MFVAISVQSKASEVERSRYASICAFRSAIFCSAVAMASAPATEHPSGLGPDWSSDWRNLQLDFPKDFRLVIGR